MDQRSPVRLPETSILELANLPTHSIVVDRRQHSQLDGITHHLGQQRAHPDHLRRVPCANVSSSSACRP